MGEFLSRSRDLYVYLISLVTFIELLLLSFVGGLVSGLGQGFDLGIEWPSEPVKLIRAFLQGSLEALHRILTVVAAPLLTVLTLSIARVGGIYRGALYISIASIALLSLTALTGRAILFALGGYIEQPYASLIYSINNLLATLTIGSVGVLVGILSRGWKERYGFEKRLTMIIHRGASAWGLVASFLGAYMLGYTKTTQNPLPGSLFSFSIVSHIDLILKIHVLSGALAIILTYIAFAMRRSRDAWVFMALVASIAQPLLGLLLLYRASHYAWAPGIFLPLHLVSAQLIVIGNGVPYIMYLLSSRNKGLISPRV
jgi:hypothetical protein